MANIAATNITTNVVLPKTLKFAIDAEKEKIGISMGAIMREALADWLDKRKEQNEDKLAA